MAKQDVEEIKTESRGLRGQIVPTLLSDASHFEEAEYQLLKFHGSYQQDNRDSRSERRKAKLDKRVDLHGAHQDARWHPYRRTVSRP